MNSTLPVKVQLYGSIGLKISVHLIFPSNFLKLHKTFVFINIQKWSMFICH